jgi:uncharacterized protein (DUF1697 family)
MYNFDQMKPYISLLRGINVSGQNKIRMEDLRRLHAELGLQKVRTYVQSGNVVFESGESDTSNLAEQIETQIASKLVLTVPVLLRSVVEFSRILNTNPFLTGRQEDPGQLYVTFLSSLPDPVIAAGLQPPAGETDEFVIIGQEIFLFCPNGYGRTKLSNNWFERKLNRVATTRNWKTVNTLYQMALETGVKND